MELIQQAIKNLEDINEVIEKEVGIKFESITQTIDTLKIAEIKDQNNQIALKMIAKINVTLEEAREIAKIAIK